VVKSPLVVLMESCTLVGRGAVSVEMLAAISKEYILCKTCELTT
jgi:hypothetical protein